MTSNPNVLCKSHIFVIGLLSLGFRRIMCGTYYFQNQTISHHFFVAYFNIHGIFISCRLGYLVSDSINRNPLSQPRNTSQHLPVDHFPFSTLFRDNTTYNIVDHRGQVRFMNDIIYPLTGVLCSSHTHTS